MIVFIGNIDGQLAVLTEDESHHCAKVLRKKAGDKIRVMSGTGFFYDCELMNVNERKCEARVLAEHYIAPRKYHLHLAIAPTKHIDRLEWMLEKCVEIGVQELSFIQSKNSERTKINFERLCKIAESAAKQSLQPYLPMMHDLTTFKELIVSSYDGQRYIAHCAAGEKISVKDVPFATQRVMVLIGPEGDFSPEEIQMALYAGYRAIDLGESRLRTETAGLYVCQAAAILT